MTCSERDTTALIGDKVQSVIDLGIRVPVVAKVRDDRGTYVERHFELAAVHVYAMLFTNPLQWVDVSHLDVTEASIVSDDTAQSVRL